MIHVFSCLLTIRVCQEVFHSKKLTEKGSAQKGEENLDNPDFVAGVV